MSSTGKKSAEDNFRGAFERLKMGRPERVKIKGPITQADVAREAGCDPSALKKDRFPRLILEIQALAATRQEKGRSQQRKRDNRSRRLQEKFTDCVKQREKLASIVVAQNSHIEELLEEIDKLKNGQNVIGFD